ncbi:hypothetical protein CSC94_21050 [Zhengella mangrovi]|uniref:Uncharacterized protein n=1 Tax=Zhengella mangrovi TaxID=1982044 RepID=A0A2G1QHT8_9HYPH|nr:hypothetical protein [Zhengella mangrovi]PHP65021.1 hypothetical protein CSC94_21050 [Zhengella mangrovi]
MKVLSAIALSFLLAGTVSAPADGDYPWFNDIRMQAESELACDVDYFLNAREGDLGGKHTQEARLQCTDGRRFDAVREIPETNFRFLACDTQVC